jgi:hypothetical protein
VALSGWGIVRCTTVVGTEEEQERWEESRNQAAELESPVPRSLDLTLTSKVTVVRKSLGQVFSVKEFNQ